MALDVDAVQICEGPGNWLNHVAVYNASTTGDIPVYCPVIVDTANIMNDAGTNNQLAVTICGTATPGNVIGFTQVTIGSQSSGRIMPLGPITNAVCYGTVNAGSVVDNCTVPSYTTRVQAHTASQFQVGVALATGADGETIPVMLIGGKNA